MRIEKRRKKRDKKDCGEEESEGWRWKRKEGKGEER